MDKNDVLASLAQLDGLGINRSGYFICYGGAMVLHGVRESTSDVDVTCDAATMTQLKALTERDPNVTCEPWKDNGSVIHFPNGLDVFDTTMSTKPEIEWLEGYWVQTLASLRAEKIARGRDKDKRDVELIDRHLSEQ